jgi:uncharacterized protein (DUF779 family)
VRTTVIIVLAALAGLASANLLVNGDFEQPIDVGWDTIAVNLIGCDTFRWSDSLGQPTPGYAAAAYKYLASYASMNQTVDVPGVNLTLTFDARFVIGGGSESCWPVASFVVRYLDAAGTSLGNSKIYLHNQYCTWAGSDTQSLIDITTPGVWTPFTLNVASELSTHLPGINPAGVNKLNIDMFAYDNGT